MKEPLQSQIITGYDLYNAFKNGAKQLSVYEEEINRINVFPVQDADTGTNLYQTSKAILEYSDWTVDLYKTVRSISQVAISEAKGSSGSIVALYLRGFQKYIPSFDGVTLKSFAQLLGSAYLYVHQSMSQPREGTILTIMRVWAEYFEKIENQNISIKNALGNSILILRDALENTKNQLDVLSRINVVDAGALGMVCFLEGCLKSFRRGRIKHYSPSKEMLAEEELVPSPPLFRYCYEVNLEGNELKNEEIKDILECYGDSLVCIPSDSCLHIHIHTDSPSEVSRYLSTIGQISKVKVDDLNQQYLLTQKKSGGIALVVDSSCDMNLTDISSHVYKIPMPMVVDNNQHLDGVTMDGRHLYEDMGLKEVSCRSSQISQGVFEGVYLKLLKRYDHVISIHISKNFSGTYDNAIRAAKEVNGKEHPKIDVWDSGTLSSAYGMMVDTIAKSIENESTLMSLREEFEVVKRKTEIWVSVRSLNAMINSGRVPQSFQKVAKLFSVYPLISMNKEGKAMIGGVAFSFDHSLRRLVSKLKKRSIKRCQVVHVGANYDSHRLEEMVQQKTEYELLPSVSVTPVIGIYAGLGAVGIVVEYE
ncbi:DegV family EDD domain-containing protein [Halosquirtibacter laminarini]|uniref:DegV family EDD domain-containing protein n=1 Tax=Halosquirtibacter laminarini TaxID=3374600 RepID=A0AC61NLR8_9BACT|nr:DegV family EDD domain-containing protein [Prolixibacteraceae bacterium]